jgi:outer membrane protein TolC
LAVDNLQAAHERIGEAYAPFLPQANATATYEPNTSNYVANPGLSKLLAAGNTNGPSACINAAGQVTPCIAVPRPGENGTAYNYFSIQLNVTQNIWDFGRTLNAMRQAKATERSTAQDLATARHTVDLNVRSAFYAALADQQLVEVAKEQVEDLKKHTALAQARFDVGAGARSDLSLAIANEQNAVVALFTAQNNVDVAKATLNQAMGALSSDISYTLVPTPLELGTKIPSVDQGTEQALQARPDFLSAIQKIDAQQRLVDAQTDNLLPSLAAAGNLGWTGYTTPLIYNWQIGITLTVPIYTGGLDFHKIAEYKATLDGLIASRDTIALQVRLDVQTAVLTAQQTKASLDSAKAAVKSGEDALALAEGQYQVGVGSIVTLDDAQVTEVTAKAGLIQADYSFETALAKLKYSLGED